MLALAYENPGITVIFVGVVLWGLADLVRAWRGAP